MHPDDNVDTPNPLASVSNFLQLS